MLLHNKVLSVVGILSDEADPLVSVMKARASVRASSRAPRTNVWALHAAPRAPTC